MNHPVNSSDMPRRMRWLWILGAVTAVAIVWGMWRALELREAKQQALQASKTQSAASLAISSSEWMALQPRKLQLGVAITGSLSAVDSAVVKARVPGELRDLQVREGDTVQAGQVIARVDATESEARFRQAKLQADAAQAQVAIQQRQYDNNRALVDRGFISATALATSQANLQAAQANYAAARAAQDGAQKTLDDTVLRSPIHGQIGQRMVQNGERVNVESPIVEVVNLSALELQAQLPANDSAQVHIGQRAQLQLRSSQGQMLERLEAQVVRINPSASSGNRAVPVYLRLTGAAASLRPGMYVEGFIHTGAQQGLAVPLNAIRTDQPVPYVQVVRDGVVQHAPVQMGARSVGTDTIWVAIEGLPADASVLLASVGAIPAGTRVQLQSAAQPAAASASSAQH
ncbi:MAG: efflux RND transporter periplasmic adaptor subunit [Comamonas sp.]